MAVQRIQETRVELLNDRGPAEGQYVLYWMQQSQRADYNHALEYAISQANALGQPLLVGFGLMDGYPEANLRHYRFLLEGLQETQNTLRARGIRLVVRHGSPDDVALELGRRASLIVCDRGYLRHQKRWRQRVAEEAGRTVVQVESDVVVPVGVVSDKAEVAARTLRPRLLRHLDDYLVGLRSGTPRHSSLALEVNGLDLEDLDAVLSRLRLDRSVAPVPLFRGGPRAAHQLLNRFLNGALEDYADNRNQPQSNHVSHMSKYLHFGQISPLYIALRVRDRAGVRQQDRDVFLEELLVRRELTCNFVAYTERYDDYAALPAWARATLDRHRGDRRPYQYTPEEFEEARTHDPYWNAAQREMRATGYMPNHMRMYWGKKILEWSSTPEEAYATALRLNNRYFLDGRDCNSYANVAWIFGQHDRPWPEHPVFGNVRSMSTAGLERKTDPHAYVEKVDRLVRALEEGADAAGAS